MRKKRQASQAKDIALKEIRSEDRQRKIEMFLLFLTIASSCSILILLTTHYLATGYATYIASKAGYVTELNITRKFPTTYWNGIYGLAIRVAGFTEQLSESLNNEIKRKDLFFDCIDTSDPGGNEVYASNASSISFSTLAPADPSELDSIMGCSGKTDCASNTYTKNMSIMVGTTNISNIPSTHTFRWDGRNDVFDIGLLKDGNGNYVFVTHIDSIQKGYNPNVTVNYQMLLPNLGGSTTYYFFTDPNDECPAGGLGNTLEINVTGYVKDEYGQPIENATVILKGESTLTNSSGKYFINTTVIEGNYTILVKKDGYDVNYTIITASFSNNSFERNFTLSQKNIG
ncbi:carboxypeptidase regulatory-like domain-containing protein, partial [Candidatus Pacearchaeota archaeon]